MSWSLQTLLATLAFAFIVVGAGALAAGCGEDPHIAYQRDLRAVGKHVASALDKIPNGGDQTVQPKQISSLATQLRHAADDVDGLGAPTDATKRAQQTFARGLRGVATALSDLAHDLARSPDEAKQAERFVQFATDNKIQRSFDDLANSQDAYARAGYRVFGDPSAVTRRPSRPASAAKATAAHSTGGH